MDVVYKSQYSRTMMLLRYQPATSLRYRKRKNRRWQQRHCDDFGNNAVTSHRNKKSSKMQILHKNRLSARKKRG